MGAYIIRERQLKASKGNSWTNQGAKAFSSGADVPDDYVAPRVVSNPVKAKTVGGV